MARQTSSSWSLLFVGLVCATAACGGGVEEFDTGIGFVGIPVSDAGAATTGGAGGTGSAGAPGGTTGSVGAAGGTGSLGAAGGTTGSVGAAGGTTGSVGAAGGTGSVGAAGGTGSAGGTAGGSDAGGPKLDAGVSSDASTSSDSGVGSTDAATPGSDASAMGMGECCAGGDCLCHGPVPTRLSAAKGPFKVATLRLSTGTAHYPTDAQAPFAGIAICPGFLNSGPEMEEWGTFYASWGIVTVVTNTIPTDVPEIRADKLLGSIKALKAENTKSGSPLNGKMSGRYGTSGYSMGGGGTTMATITDPTLKTSVGLAPWEPVGRNIKVPTLLMCGSIDLVAPCGYVDDSYAAIPNTTPKMKIVISGGEHLATWFGPNDGGNGTSGGYALAFQKVFLEGDERWKTLLLTKPSGHEMTTNITK